MVTVFAVPPVYVTVVYLTDFVFNTAVCHHQKSQSTPSIFFSLFINNSSFAQQLQLLLLRIINNKKKTIKYSMPVF